MEDSFNASEAFKRMRPPVVESAFDVALWFLDRALEDNEYLQPQKLHRILFLSQAYFAVANQGRKLMPATFIADEPGPVEPNVYRAFEHGRPYMEPGPMKEAVQHFLDSIWRRFGSHSAEYLSRQLANHPPVAAALKKERRTEITLAAMVKFYGAQRSERAARATEAPAVDQVLRPRVMRSSSGKPVNVSQWMPPAVKKGKSAKVD